MKSYRSSSTFVTVDLLFHELLPFVQNSFSGLFFTLLSHIWMKVGRKLRYEELQINFDFRHGWPTFSWVIALCLQFVFQTFLSYDFTFLTKSWYQVILTVIFWKVHEHNSCLFKFVGAGGGPVLLKQYSQYACFLWIYVKIFGELLFLSKYHLLRTSICLTFPFTKCYVFMCICRIYTLQKKVMHNILVYRQVQIIVAVTCVLYINYVIENKE